MEILSLLIALTAVIVGPWISYKITKKQITANLVSANRQKWIDDFRGLVADYLSTYSIMSNESVVSKSQKELFNKYYLKLFSLKYTFEMQLQYNSKHRSEFMKLVGYITTSALELITHGPQNIPDFKLIKNLAEISHKIIQDEMKLISQGK